MLKTRIAPAIALAVGVALGTTGCGLLVPQATTYEYAPSDGIDVDLPGLSVRNLLVLQEDGDANIVFTGVNSGDEQVRMSITFVADGSQVAQKNFNLAPGLTSFGVDSPETVRLDGVPTGSMVTAFIEGGGKEIEREVPVLGSDLEEYVDLVP